MFGKPTPAELLMLDVEIVHASAQTGRSVPDTADLLRAEALAGPWYRGDNYDRAPWISSIENPSAESSASASASESSSMQNQPSATGD